MGRGVVAAAVVAVIGAGLVWWGVLDSHCEWVRSDVSLCHGTLRGLVATAIGGVGVGASGAIAGSTMIGRRGARKLG